MLALRGSRKPGAETARKWGPEPVQAPDTAQMLQEGPDSAHVGTKVAVRAASSLLKQSTILAIELSAQEEVSGWALMMPWAWSPALCQQYVC